MRIRLESPVEVSCNGFFDDSRFSAPLWWVMLEASPDPYSNLEIHPGVERQGDILILNNPSDLPSHALAWGMRVALPLDIVGRDHVWQFRFYRHGSFAVFALNDIPLAVLGSDALIGTPLPPSICPLAVAWCAFETLDGIEGSSNVERLQIESLRPLGLEAMEVLRFLPNLKHLEFVGRAAGTMSPELLPPALESFTMGLPAGMEDLSFLPELAGLESLTLNRCRRLKDLSALENVQGIRDLKIRGAAGLTDITAIGNLCWLRAVDLSGATGLQHLRPLSFLDGLECLSLFGCESIRNVWPLAGLERLRLLDLTGCNNIKSFLPLKALPNVEVILPE